MKRKILLPTDFSKNAWHAISYAMELYKKDHCDFYILNVFNGNSDMIGSLLNMEPGTDLYETSKSDAEDGLAKVMDMLVLKDYHNSKHHFETLARYNSVVEAIRIIVEEKDINMIVMGTKGKTDSRTNTFGSVATEVMEKVRNCPVIVVPELAKRDLPKEIVFPTSFKTHIKHRELDYLIDLAQKCDAAIRILHINSEKKLNATQENNKALLEEYFYPVAHSYHHLSHVEVPVGINCFVESRESDMVAFINKKHSFFHSMLTHPLVKQIAYISRVPILVMHDLRN